MHWYQQRWPWFLMAGPAVAIGACSYMSYLAFAHQDALVVGDYYKQGKAINQDLRRDRAAASLGLSATLRYDAAEGLLRGQVNSASLLPQQVLTVRLAHATQPERDVQLLVRPDADGRFGIPLPMLERSRWQVLIESERRDWRMEGEWQWPVEREVRIVTRPDTPAP